MLSPIKNKRVQARKEDFINLINSNKEKAWYICSHDNPDPDSLASALGIQKILNFLGAENVEITYCGEIGHPQNRAMVNVLDTLQISKWEDISDDIESDAMFIFADCSLGQKNISIKKTPVIVVDHHKIITTNKSVLFIHDEVGACSTLVFDLALSITKLSDDEGEKLQCFDPNEDGIKELATALSIGIKTDTLDFLSEGATDNDIQAFRLLARHLSDEKFHRIINYEFPPYVLDFEQIAWQNKKNEFQPHFITGLGYIDDAKSDCIPTIADKFMRLQGVQTVVVYGIVGRCVRSSVRTSGSSLDCQTLCDDIFGKGNGGAKQGVGGARVPFNVFNPLLMGEKDKKSLWTLVKSQIESRFEKATTK